MSATRLVLLTLRHHRHSLAGATPPVRLVAGCSGRAPSPRCGAPTLPSAVAVIATCLAHGTNFGFPAS
jgi:hypothetical protein